MSAHAIKTLDQHLNIQGVRWLMREMRSAEHRSALIDNVSMREELRRQESSSINAGIHLPTLNLADAKRDIVERAISLSPNHTVAAKLLGVSPGSLTRTRKSVGLPAARK